MKRHKFLCLALAAGILFSVCKAEKPIETIAFGSCLKQTRPQPIWESVRAGKPDVFVLLGDSTEGRQNRTSERPFLLIGSVLGIELLDAELHRKVGV